MNVNMNTPVILQPLNAEDLQQIVGVNQSPIGQNDAPEQQSAAQFDQWYANIVRSNTAENAQARTKSAFNAYN